MHILSALLLCAAGTLASKPRPHLPAAPRTHNNLALRLRGPTNGTGMAEERRMDMEKRDTYTGVAMTWYPTDTGPDACTGKNHKDSDWFVAMNYNQYGDGSACCGKQLRIDYNGKSTIATCVDECASCDTWGSLDLTQGLFEFFVGDPGIGEFYGSWSFADSSSSSGDDDTTTTSTQEKTTSHTTTPTPTTHSTTSTHTTTSTTSTHTTSSTHSSSSAKPSSSARPSSSAAKSSAQPSSSSATPSASVQTQAQTTGTQNLASFNDVMLNLVGLVVQAGAAQ